MTQRLTALTARQLYDGGRLIDYPVVVFEDNCIVSISARTENTAPYEAHIVDFPDATLAAGGAANLVAVGLDGTLAASFSEQ
jgi:N-acetylglucosamine-6-phosphate deacetylase